MPLFKNHLLELNPNLWLKYKIAKPSLGVCDCQKPGKISAWLNNRDWSRGMWTLPQRIDQVSEILSNVRLAAPCRVGGHL